MRIVYVCAASSTIEESTYRPGDMAEAKRFVNDLFAQGRATFAQVLRDDGWVEANLVPLNDRILPESAPAVSTTQDSAALV